MDNKLYKKIKTFIKENLFFIIVLLLIITINVVRLPWSIYAPGGTIKLNNRLENTKYKTTGSFNMTYVSFIKGNIPTLLLALINPSWDIISNNELTLEGEELEEAEIRDRLSLKQSVSDAILLAYNKAKIDPEIISKKIYISYIFDKMKKGELSRVLIVATGALLNSSLVNQKITIPSIAHAVSLEVIE